MDSAAPTIVAVQTDSAWVVILAVSAATLLAVMLVRRLIHHPGGIASGLLLCLPLALPLIAAVSFDHAALPVVAILDDAGALRDEAPAYRNEALGFWALSRHADVLAAFKDPETFSNRHGVSLDRDVEVIGPVEMVLFAASSAKDTDFIVRVCDVYPDGRSMLLTQGIRRLRCAAPPAWRDGGGIRVRGVARLSRRVIATPSR